mgnify:CR=1 FL=1
MSSLPITESFGSYLVDERRFSPYTARCYGADLRQYIEHLMAETGINPNPSDETAELRRRHAHPHAPPVEAPAQGNHDRADRTFTLGTERQRCAGPA